jgi:ketosteroid isomerase-like protein
MLSCGENTNEKQIAHWKEEIRQAEKSFCKLAKDEGISTAFLEYAAEDAVIMRKNVIVAGRDQINSYLNQGEPNPSQSLIWKPDFIDVSSSGDLGYTYGEFVFTSKDSLGNEIKNEGVFHTVWKRQLDGSWKFVWA